MMTALSRTNPVTARGLTLVELMVAMLVGLFLVAGLLQISMSQKVSYGFQQAKSGNQENLRFAYYYLDTLVGRAGYLAQPQNSEFFVYGPLAATAQCAAFLDGQLVAASLEGNGVCLRYQRADAAEVDCMGNAIATTDAFVTRVFLDSATNRLMCGAQGVAAVPLVDNIERLNVSYGLTNSSDLSNRSVDGYVTAPTGTEWRQIVAVRFSLLASREAGGLTSTQSYHFPMDAPDAITGADRRVYFSGLKTVTLRNTVL
jgi:type IV pilus assembly protein PilW